VVDKADHLRTWSPGTSKGTQICRENYQCYPEGYPELAGRVRVRHHQPVGIRINTMDGTFARPVGPCRVLDV
jgi:hypothetical protein